jgi:hypothetical protein
MFHTPEWFLTYIVPEWYETFKNMIVYDKYDDRNLQLRQSVKNICVLRPAGIVLYTYLSVSVPGKRIHAVKIVTKKNFEVRDTIFYFLYNNLRNMRLGIIIHALQNPFYGFLNAVQVLFALLYNFSVVFLRIILFLAFVKSSQSAYNYSFPRSIHSSHCCFFAKI